MKLSKKLIALMLSIMLLIGGIAGSTLAWLMDSTDTIVNTFTVGDINIELDESDDLSLKLVPGNDVTKDPKVTVLSGSEKCWLFVKVEETNREVAGSSPSYNYFNYAISDNVSDMTEWAALTNPDGVYCRLVDNALNSDVTFEFLQGNKVSVPSNVTKADLAVVKDNPPKLTFTAYAVQWHATDLDTPEKAWAQIMPAGNGGNV